VKLIIARVITKEPIACFLIVLSFSAWNPIGLSLTASIEIAAQRRPSGEAKRADKAEDEAVMLIPPEMVTTVCAE
jgi:hypothetical protein